MESRNIRLFKIIFVIESIILSTILILYIYNQRSIFDLNDKLDEITNINNNTSSLDKEINDIKNLDENLTNKYDEYFTNIRKLEEKVKNKETDKKIAYLTFDDGPYKLTNTVLDILKEKNAKATFFVLGKESTKDRY